MNQGSSMNESIRSEQAPVVREAPRRSQEVPRGPVSFGIWVMRWMLLWRRSDSRAQCVVYLPRRPFQAFRPPQRRKTKHSLSMQDPLFQRVKQTSLPGQGPRVSLLKCTSWTQVCLRVFEDVYVPNIWRQRPPPRLSGSNAPTLRRGHGWQRTKIGQRTSSYL